MITVFGSINMDLVAPVRRIARPGETVLSPRADSFFGGKGANQAVAAARMGGDDAIGVSMAAAVGDDAFGKACLDNLRKNGIDVEAVRIVDEPTGCAFITVDDAGENAITVASGANMAVRAADVPERLLSGASVVVLQMEVPFIENLEMARRARKVGATVVWNVAPVPAAVERGAMADMLAMTDVLVVNEHEALAVAALVGEDAGSDYLKASSILAQVCGLVCIVTAGAKGAVAVSPDGAQRQAVAWPVTAVDTTGAGDTFVGVLARGLAERRDLGDAMRRACVAASLSCRAVGAQAGMPTRAVLERALLA
ncbi:ribokinase [Microvirga makkahensis]|uniref:Ribokinase n=1 Tax=Microvirga makkahensis TaxID=1128670 RepID=A0A7X3MR25_9HYPH|nr:ribokinase [Microvirga makkahensis]MXQ11639.1 ribokinase [Microvirga makkahensis]